MSRWSPLLFVPLFAFWACSSGSGSGDATGTGATSGSGGGAGDGGETCTATFRWLQKDAYKETAGRSSELWPPHTTTTLDIECNGALEKSAFRENHGTKPTDVDANGDVFLVEVGSMQVAGPRSELEALAVAYEACECGTQFLSMDALGDATVQTLVGKLSEYITAHLTCTGSVNAAGVVQLLQTGDIPGVLAALPNCTWESGSDFAGGFDTALLEIIGAAQETLADYHVCNNDAKLEAALIKEYQSTGQVGTCDAEGPVCHGPLWYYVP